MIDKILDIMETIVEFIFDMVERMSEFVVNIAYGLAFLLILATVPIWFIPFMIWKARQNG